MVTDGVCGDVGFPSTLQVQIGQFKIGMCHGHQIVPWGVRRLLSFFLLRFCCFFFIVFQRLLYLFHQRIFSTFVHVAHNHKHTLLFVLILPSCTLSDQCATFHIPHSL
jgi:hypothetical protein